MFDSTDILSFQARGKAAIFVYKTVQFFRVIFLKKKKTEFSYQRMETLFVKL